MFVYVIVNSETLKIYIGQHKGENLRQYLQQKLSEARHYFSRRSRLYASMRKHRKESWSIHPLLSDLQTREECDSWERHYIATLKAQHPDVGYNICRGGEGFSGPHSEATKIKLDAIRKKYWSDPEHHQLRREISKKMWADPEKKKEISQAIKNAPNTGRKQPGFIPWNIGTTGIMKPNSGSFQLGHVRAPNSGAKGPNRTSFKLGHTNGLGRKFSDEHIRNLSLSHMGLKNPDKGKTRSPETKQKMRDAWARRKAEQKIKKQLQSLAA